METESETKPIICLMPSGYTRLIIAEAGEGSPSNICEVVKTERINSKKWWPYVEKLALAKDPNAYKARLEFLQSKRQLVTHVA